MAEHGTDVPHGLSRYSDGWVMVDYGRHQAPVSRPDYEERGYEPSFESGLGLAAPAQRVSGWASER